MADEQRHHLCPIIHIDSPSHSTIYVNNIINTPHGSSQTLVIPGPSGDKNTDVENPRSQSNSVNYNLKEAGSIKIFCDPMKAAGNFEPSRTDKPSMIVEFHKLSSKGTSEIEPMPAYVITIHKNNVPGDESRTAARFEGEPVAIDHTIKAENVILNTLGGLNIGTGAGAKNHGHGAGSLINVPKS